MPIQSKKANDIQAYIDSHSECKKNKQKIVIDGRVETLDSYLLPVSYLQYNHNNSRFALEIIEKETEIGRKLDMSDSEDIKVIKSLLLQDTSEAKSLKDDLKKLGEQTEVAAITHDGVVINGNRRMATLEDLNKDEPTGKWQKLWVVRLPTNISQKDLWKIEAGLQLSKDKVAEYGPVNDLLMIKEGKTAGLEPAEIAAAMYGWKEDEVNAALERLNLIDVFLSFMKAPNNYGIIKKFRLTEHFIDIQKGLLNKLKDEGIFFTIYPVIQQKLDASDPNKAAATQQQVMDLRNKLLAAYHNNVNLYSPIRITNRKCKVFLKPRLKSCQVMIAMPNSKLSIINTRGKWVMVTCLDRDSLPVTGWILKKYLSKATLKAN